MVGPWKWLYVFVNKNKMNPCPCGVQRSREETDSLAVKFSPRGKGHYTCTSGCFGSPSKLETEPPGEQSEGIVGISQVQEGGKGKIFWVKGTL